ncbi:MAG: hypothetical protein F4X02_13575 [Chloroflexi bacterium]|nr:hypothetical protein [Chloroflexota bacterium]
MSLQGRISNRAQSSGASDSGDANGAGAANSLPGPTGNATASRIQSLMASGPQRMTVMLVLMGMVLGLATAYVIIPTEFTGASPRHMSRDAIRQWVRMIAVGHSQEVHYDDSNALLVLQQIPNPQAVVEGLASNAGVPAAERAALEALMDIPGYANLTGALAPQDPGVVGSTLQVAASLAAVALAIPLLVIAGRVILPAGNAKASNRRGREQLAKASPPSADAAALPSEQPLQAYSEAPAATWGADETEESGAIHPQYGVPVLRALSTYVKGNNLDDSFAIELPPDAGGQFLGECGVSGATQVGNELQSVEFWGFDMASQETLTKVFAAPAALHDPALHAAVASRVSNAGADIVAAEPGARLVLDSGAIHIQARVKSVVCNYGGGTPNSGIESLQIEILAWHKQTVPSSMPASGYPAPANSPFNEYAEMQFGPPSETTSPSPPPGGSMSAPRPASSAGQPAPKRPEDEEEDPFGGTGNFMPYS